MMFNVMAPFSAQLVVYSGPLRLLFVFEMKVKVVIMTDAYSMSECDGIADHAARTP
jgi:hypothetical protein